MPSSRTVVLALVFVLATGMASGAYLSTYGQITGSVDVDGIDFYAGNSSNLLINEPPNSSQEGMDYIGNYMVAYYSTRELNKEWYPVEVTMNAKAKLYDSDSPNTRLDVNFEYVNSTGQFSVCENERSIKVDSANYKNYSATCQGNISGEVETFEYVLRGSSDTEVFVKTDGVTGVELRGK